MTTATDALLASLQEAADDGAARAASREELFRWDRVRLLVGALQQR